MRHADIKVRPVLFGTVCYGAQVQVYLKKTTTTILTLKMVAAFKKCLQKKKQKTKHKLHQCSNLIC